MASASVQLRTSKISVSAGRVAAARTWRLNPLLNWLRRTASATVWRDAESQRPRPGSLRFKSGITSPEGETTNRISSSIGSTCRVTAHIRTVADLSVRGPLSRSGAAKASMRRTALLTSARIRGAKPLFIVVEHASNRLIFGGLGLVGLLDEIGLGNPAGDDARLHDHVLCLVARGFVGIEDAGMLGRFAA